MADSDTDSDSGTDSTWRELDADELLRSLGYQITARHKTTKVESNVIVFRLEMFGSSTFWFATEAQMVFPGEWEIKIPPVPSLG